MNAETIDPDVYVYTMPRNLQIGLLVASAVWVSVNGHPLMPPGLIIPFIVVAQKYETTRLASLRTGWRMLAKCVAASCVSYVLLFVL